MATLHQNQPIMHQGAALENARAAMILIHGRGASAQDILLLANEFDQAQVAYFAPQADGNTWYPNSFLMPIASNEPGISAGMAAITAIMEKIAAAGIPAEKTMLLGFSQGACLATEYAARHARRYGGVFGLSGGLIGPDGTPRDYAGSLDGTPVFLGCSDVDFHIPKERVQESAEVLQRLGGDVTMRLYRNMGHTVNEDELGFVRAVVDQVRGL